MSVALVWFRRDLRLGDNPALAAALAAHERVVPVYVHAPDEEAPWAPGAASRWWLHRSLAALDADLRTRGAALHVVRGESPAALREIAAAVGAGAVYWNRLYEPAAIRRDAVVEAALCESGLAAESFNAALLAEPRQIATAAGDPYRVFTPFWRNLRAQLEPRPPLAAPKRIASVEAGGSVPIEALRLLPRVRWDAGFDAAWQPGEAGAVRALTRFVERALDRYATRRDFPGEAGTSRLSPHLHFGEISPMRIVWALEDVARGEGREAFLRELGWREFSHHLLYHFPQSAERNLNDAFDRFAWARAAQLRQWQQGRTGIPIVDAGMRELWSTGWMHNRVRMLAASFLTKNLRQPWTHGARWFWDTLVDADLANNTQGWQWTAGTGADAAPYFRIFNPVAQGERFDPDGEYVRRWVPELARFGARTIHRPWTDPAALRASGYPAPMADLGETRAAALAAYQACKRPARPKVD